MWALLAALTFAGPAEEAVAIELHAAMAQASVDRIQLEAEVGVWGAWLAEGRVQEVALALESPTLEALMSDRNAGALDKVDALGKFGPKHPTVQSLDTKLEEIDKLLKEQVGTVIAAKRVQVQVLVAQEQALAKALETAR